MADIPLEGAALGTTYWAVPQCPLCDECNERNFKNWKCWGETPQEARDKLSRHLRESGLHKMHEANEGDRSAEYDLLVESVEVWEYALETVPKRQAKKRMAPTTPTEPPPTHLRSSAAGAGGGAGSSSGSISMSTQQLKELSEIAARAHRAANNAARLSAAAATAFAQEAAAFADVQVYADAQLMAASMSPRAPEIVDLTEDELRALQKVRASHCAARKARSVTRSGAASTRSSTGCF